MPPRLNEKGVPMNRAFPPGQPRFRLLPCIVLAVSVSIPALTQETAAPAPASAPSAAESKAESVAGSTSETDFTLGTPIGAISEEDESSNAQVLSETNKFSAGNEGKDPFKPLIVKKPIQLIQKEEKKREDQEPPKKQTEPIPPLVVNVSGICGNEGERLAMIFFENKPFVVHKEMNVDGKFKVVDVLDDRLVVFSFKEQIRRTFPIGGGKE